MKKILVLILTLALCLSGCSSWMEGHYVSVTPYEDPGNKAELQTITANNYGQLCQAIRTMVRSGSTSGVISVAAYDQATIDVDKNVATNYILTNDPIAAYAVENISVELGTHAGQPALAVEIRYIHDRSEIMAITRVHGEDDAVAVIAAELGKYNTGVVLHIEEYEELDFVQWIADYAAKNPNLVMETPEVTVNIYPKSGSQRVAELKFTYQNSRESLRTIQSQVTPMFTAANLYVAGNAPARGKYTQLYTFLMERFDSIKLETSITPAYSLLLHGVGDSKAIATVYAAMCRQAGLECITVTGTRWGEPWFWNIIRDKDTYYHVDLLRCREEGTFRTWTDEELSGYVWDYAAYPKCQ